MIADSSTDVKQHRHVLAAHVGHKRPMPSAGMCACLVSCEPHSVSSRSKSRSSQAYSAVVKKQQLQLTLQCKMLHPGADQL